MAVKMVGQPKQEADGNDQVEIAGCDPTADQETGDAQERESHHRTDAGIHGLDRGIEGHE